MQFEPDERRRWEAGAGAGTVDCPAVLGGPPTKTCGVLSMS
jgi:hypothetical protein